MDYEAITQFVREMNFWNWLTLIGFLFVPLSALNAFLSLRTRFKDWWAIRSERTFIKRLEVSLRTFEETSMAFTKPTPYQLAFKFKVVDIAIEFCFAVMVIAWILFFQVTFNDGPIGNIIINIFKVVSFILLLRTVLNLIKLRTEVFQARYPSFAADHIIEYLKKGVSRGFIADPEPYLVRLHDADIWSDEGRASVISTAKEAGLKAPILGNASLSLEAEDSGE